MNKLNPEAASRGVLQIICYAAEHKILPRTHRNLQKKIARTRRILNTVF